MKTYYVYIATNNSETLYTGVTNNLDRRMFEHANHVNAGFTDKYKIDKLLYFEQTQDVNEAIAREKQIKNWRRDKKLFLINRENPNWYDLLDRSLHFGRDDSGVAK